ncbi:hypothetical protein Tco_1504192 [Tanacetum coccineum]
MSATESEYIVLQKVPRKFHYAFEREFERPDQYLEFINYVRESVVLGKIKILKVHTDNNLADPFTKALSNRKLTQHARSMGIRPARSFIDLTLDLGGLARGYYTHAYTEDDVNGYLLTVYHFVLKVFSKEGGLIPEKVEACLNLLEVDSPELFPCKSALFDGCRGFHHEEQLKKRGRDFDSCLAIEDTFGHHRADKD